MEARLMSTSDLPSSTDVIVIGGGIIGCATAAMIADRGARVVLLERSAIGAGASGRNMGALQHPFDAVLAELHRESMTRYRALAETPGTEFRVGSAPAGILLVTRDPEGAVAQARRMADAFPELRPRALDPDELVALEPSLAHGPSAVRLETGYPVAPAAATVAWAALADERGAWIAVGAAARPRVVNDRVIGAVLDDGTEISSDAVLVAAGPWSPALVDPDGAWQPISATYGVTLQLELGPNAPHHILEEDEVSGLSRAEAATARAANALDGDPPSLFSLATAAGVTTLGSTFLPVEPDAARIEPLLLQRAAAFLPAVAKAPVIGRRMCARPQSIDGRPFIGAVPGTEGLFVCAGHGPWGMSTGPASAAIAARAILDGTDPPPELDPARLT